jgi:hypothetical protein
MVAKWLMTHSANFPIIHAVLKWQRLKLLLRVALTLVSEEHLWQALAARFPGEASVVTNADVWIDPRKRRWEIIDNVSARRHVIGQPAAAYP